MQNTKLLEYSPNDKTNNLILSILYHNEGKFALSHSIMVKLKKLYPDCQVVDFYAREFLGENEKKYDLTTDIPQFVQEEVFELNNYAKLNLLRLL
jgi:hypothetical protein